MTQQMHPIDTHGPLQPNLNYFMTYSDPESAAEMRRLRTDNFIAAYEVYYHLPPHAQMLVAKPSSELKEEWFDSTADYESLLAWSKHLEEKKEYILFKDWKKA